MSIRSAPIPAQAAVQVSMIILARSMLLREGTARRSSSELSSCLVSCRPCSLRNSSEQAGFEVFTNNNALSKYSLSGHFISTICLLIPFIMIISAAFPHGIILRTPCRKTFNKPLLKCWKPSWFLWSGCLVTLQLSGILNDEVYAPWLVIPWEPQCFGFLSDFCFSKMKLFQKKKNFNFLWPA